MNTNDSRIQEAVLQLLTTTYPPQALLSNVSMVIAVCEEYRKVEDPKQAKKYAGILREYDLFVAKGSQVTAAVQAAKKRAEQAAQQPRRNVYYELFIKP